MSQLDQYLAAVAKRKARNEKSNVVNVAVVMQLEDNDVPRHHEIIRLLWNYVCQLSNLDPGDIEGDEDLCADIVTKSCECLERVEKLASEGSKAKWGEYKKDEH